LLVIEAPVSSLHSLNFVCYRVTDKKPLYPKQIKALQEKFEELIPGAKQSVGTYAYSDATMNQNVKGTYIVQYTPYDHSSGRSRRTCRPQAKVRVSYESHQIPVIEKTWESLTAQRNLKRDGSDELCEIIRDSFWPRHPADKPYRRNRRWR
jgi:hypothetical protein